MRALRKETHLDISITEYDSDEADEADVDSDPETPLDRDFSMKCAHSVCAVSTTDHIPVLTHRENLKPKSQLQIEWQRHESRECDAMNTWRDARWIELEDHYEALVEDRLSKTFALFTLPNICDGTKFWTNLVNTDEGRIPIDRKRFLNSPFTAQFDNSVRHYLKAIKAAFSALVPAPDESRNCYIPLPKGHTTAPHKLRRPTALFVCSTHSGMKPCSWEAIHAHWREEHAHETIWRWGADAEELDIVGSGLTEKLQLWEDGLQLARAVLGALKLYEDTDVRWLDGLVTSGRLCCKCEGTLPPEARDWVHLVSVGQKSLSSEVALTRSVW